MQLRDYQAVEVERALQWLRSAPPGSRRMAQAPTGTGKGIIQLTLLRLLNAAGFRTALLSPSLTIIRGLMRHFPGCEPHEVDIYTPVKFINTNPAGYECLIVDECHEWDPENILPKRIESFLPLSRWIGYTATSYRASHLATYRLRGYWGEPSQIISLTDAIARGFFSLPSIEVIPLVDDDGLPTQGAEFVVKPIEEYYLQNHRAVILAELIDSLHNAGRSIIVSVASRRMGEALAALCKTPATYMGQHTPAAEREQLYHTSEHARHTILQLGVLYRGADLPWLDVLIDAQPTLSPTRWVQTVGRITRPYHGKPKSLIITNRNFERHGWLLSGHLPKTREIELINKFDSPLRERKDLSRWLGFEKTRKSWELTAEDGTTYLWYRFALPSDGLTVTHIGLLVQPSNRTCVWGKRVMKASPVGWTYEPWESCPPPATVTGLRSAQDTPPTHKQLKFWDSGKRYAKLVGTPQSAEQITALGFIMDLKKRRKK